MLRALPALLLVAVTIYAVIDCLQSQDHAVRALPKLAWVFVILLFPLVGSIAWFIAGRPAASPSGPTSFPRWQDHGNERGRPKPPKGPDDDDDFLKGL